MKIKNAFILLALIAVAAGCRTRDTKTADAPPPVGLNANESGTVDSLFIRDALADGAHDMEMSRLGLQQANNLDLRLLAQRIFDDHQRALAELRMLAYLEKIPVTQEQRPTGDLSALAKLSGPAFDRAYIRHLQDAHSRTITIFESAGRNAHNDEVRSFASRFLPLLQEHVRIAENISTTAKLVDPDDVNEPAGAEPKQEKIDPYYRGDSKVRHQFNP